MLDVLASIPQVDYRLFDASDTRFLGLRNTLDTVSVSVRKEGIGVSKSHAAAISSEDQKLMWESGVLGTDSPWALVRAVQNFTLAYGAAKNT